MGFSQIKYVSLKKPTLSADNVGFFQEIPTLSACTDEGLSEKRSLSTRASLYKRTSSFAGLYQKIR